MTETAAVQRGPDVEYQLVITLDAPPEEVFRAWTDPERLTHWFAPHGFSTPRKHIDLDVRPGGSWQAEIWRDNAPASRLSGTYVDVDRPERLVFTTGDPSNRDGTPASVVTVAFVDLLGRTEMRFCQAGYHTAPAHADRARAGWVQFFERLTAYLEADHPE
ncbi:SRPBCC family protein [Plantactinospora sonchi]|uniref:SRPBCC domain-containing protein n=1 Tax=Plantactinospora sonchi TaxID=1544735 RepID=A0ABU7RS02_9ACTN